jgi:hypothetical protein
MKKIILVINTVVSAIFISSCENFNTNSETNTADVLTVDSSSMIPSDEPQEYISIPAPEEMFSFMKNIKGIKKSTSYLNNPTNCKNYVNTKSKALNFGIYATDFLYCSTFDYSIEGLKYFVSVKKLGDELGISRVINESMGERIKNNIGKSDSLANISNALYFTAISELEKSDKANILSMVIAGGWIESLNLATNMVTKFKNNDPAIDRIAEQKYTLRNLIDYLNKYKADENVASIMGQLHELNVLFDQLKEKSTSGAIALKGNKKILEGGTTISISEDQYKAISAKVKSIRNSFTIIK